MKKSLLLPALALTMAGTVLFATQTFAETTDPQQTLIEQIASKFNLNKDDVKAVFDQNRANKQAQMQQRFEAKLTQLVTDGKLTEDQKTKILEKVKELESNRAAEVEKLKSMTPAERKVAMKTYRDELTQWASDNGIDLKSLGLFGFGMGMMGSHDMGM
jgi:hypothetical protein